MNVAAPLLLSLLVGTAALGQPATPDPMPFDPADHRWTHRLLYVFAPSDDHPDLVAQRQSATGFVDGFRDRDLLFVSVLDRGESRADGRAIDAASAQALREAYGIEPGAFAVVLVGKDGTAKRRSDAPVAIEVLFQQIDGMPMRQREMRDRDRQ
ncbi:MAG: DUF4174 domain-containing protein [Rhodothermales bacterium]